MHGIERMLEIAYSPPDDIAPEGTSQRTAQVDQLIAELVERMNGIDVPLNADTLSAICFSLIIGHTLDQWDMVHLAWATAYKASQVHAAG